MGKVEVVLGTGRMTREIVSDYVTRSYASCTLVSEPWPFVALFLRPSWPKENGRRQRRGDESKRKDMASPSIARLMQRQKDGASSARNSLDSSRMS